LGRERPFSDRRGWAMSCEAEQLALAEALENLAATEDAFYAAFEAWLEALEALQQAIAERDRICDEHWYRNHWIGDCADADEAVETARGDVDDAFSDYETAKHDYEAALAEVDALTNEVCDCFKKNPE
jgi:tetratricopeptide (TPR) repeat protein